MPLKQAMPSVLAGLGLGPKLEEYSILERWPEIVGAAIAAETKAERIKDGKLWIRVSHSTWRNELTFMKAKLIASVNEAFGKEIITDIVLR